MPTQRGDEILGLLGSRLVKGQAILMELDVAVRDGVLELPCLQLHLHQ